MLDECTNWIDADECLMAVLWWLLQGMSRLPSAYGALPWWGDCEWTWNEMRIFMPMVWSGFSPIKNRLSNAKNPKPIPSHHRTANHNLQPGTITIRRYFSRIFQFPFNTFWRLVGKIKCSGSAASFTCSSNIYHRRNTSSRLSRQLANSQLSRQYKTVQRYTKNEIKIQ